MRIALVGTYKEIGGITTHIVQLAQQLRLMGNEVSIIPNTALNSLPAMTYYLNKLTGYEIVHIHGLKDVPPLVAGLVMGRIHGATTVCTAHGFKPPSWFESLWKRAIMKSTIRHYDAIISVSEYVRNHLAGFVDKNDSKHYVIYNGVDLDVFDPAVDPSFFRERYQLQGKKVVLYTGRLVPNKGVQFLIEATRSLRDERQDLRVLIGGKGPMEEELRAKATSLGLDDCLQFLGFTPANRMVQLYACADIVVVPSTYDPMPIVLLEAMSMRKALISTKVGGIPEVIRDGVTGILVPPADSQALADAIRAAMRGDLAERMGIAARSDVEDRFTWKKVARETANVYLEATSS
jgi:glycosyltransferase involved in cell wall biosynthesis